MINLSIMLFDWILLLLMSFTVPVDCQCLAVGVAAVLILLSGLIDLKIIIKSPAGQLCYAISCFYACPTLFCITVSRKKWEKIVACHRHKSKWWFKGKVIHVCWWGHVFASAWSWIMVLDCLLECQYMLPVSPPCKGKRHERWCGPSQRTRAAAWAAAIAASTEAEVAAWECCFSSPPFLFFLSLPQCLPHLQLKSWEDLQSADRARSSHLNPSQCHGRVCENCLSGCLLSTYRWQLDPSCLIHQDCSGNCS